MFIFICFEPFLLMVKIQNQFLTAAEKQPIVFSKQLIVFSKQPIVLSLTSLWRNQFNFYFEFLSVADQIKERILGQWICVESWSCSQGIYNSHKGIYSTILEIQEVLMTSQRSHVKTMWFSAFSDVFSAGHGQVLSLWKSGTHSCHWMLYDSVFAIKYVAADLFHKNNQLQHLLQNLVWAFLCFFLCHHGLNSSHLKESQN